MVKLLRKICVARQGIAFLSHFMIRNYILVELLPSVIIAVNNREIIQAGLAAF